MAEVDWIPDFEHRKPLLYVVLVDQTGWIGLAASLFEMAEAAFRKPLFWSSQVSGLRNRSQDILMDGARKARDARDAIRGS